MHTGKLPSIFSSILLFISSCADIDEMNNRLDAIETKIAQLESVVSQVNSNAIAISHALKDSVFLSVTENNMGYMIETTAGDMIQITDGSKCPTSRIPVIGVNPEGQWTMSVGGGSPTVIAGAANAYNDFATPKVRIDDDGYWQVSLDGCRTWAHIIVDGQRLSAIDGKEHLGRPTFFEEIIYENGADKISFKLTGWDAPVTVPIISDFFFKADEYKENDPIMLGEAISYTVSSAGVKEIAITVPDGWNAKLTEGVLTVTAPFKGDEGDYSTRLTIVSDKGYLKFVNLTFHLVPQQFTDIPDFSYAGYMRGEAAPANIETLGYTVYDITAYGGDPGVGNNDREAFLTLLTDIFGGYTADETNRHLSFTAKEDAKAIIYFPAGEYILHQTEDETANYGILIQGGDLVIKGDGADKSVIVMKEPMQLKNDELYSSPELITIKHNSSHTEILSTVSGNSAKGSFSVNVNDASGIHAGSWVCLYIKNKTDEFIAKELGSYQCNAAWTNLRDGIEVIDYHQVKTVEGNTVTFHEPLMHEVEAKYGWEVRKFPHYENIGIEDICFRGNAGDNFIHHGTGNDWHYDGGYKPISMMRVVNSWIRRVTFESVSEACSIINSANVSAYHIEMTGKRGHSSIRSQASSRVLIAGTVDNTRSSDGIKGNFHGVGVSKQSIGAVLYRNRIGDDSCFESHASQPRATLIDCCEGGWHKGHQGGADSEFPHHLADLTIWNYKATKTSESGNFTWWSSNPKWYFLPPVIVGFQGRVTFDETQSKKISSHGIEPHPQSLYESQLEKRLGAVPVWLNNLK